MDIVHEAAPLRSAEPGPLPSRKEDLNALGPEILEEANRLPQVILVFGDLLAFLFFGALGRESHGLEVNLGTAIGAAYPLRWPGSWRALFSAPSGRSGRPGPWRR